MREKIALLVMTHIGRNFHHGEAGWTTRALSQKLDIAIEALGTDGKVIKGPFAPMGTQPPIFSHQAIIVDAEQDGDDREDD